MKKLFLSLWVAITLSATGFAQNVFPTPSGNTGIGTITPSELLNVKNGDILVENGDINITGGKIGVGTTTPTDAIQVATGNIVLPYNSGGGTSGNFYLGGKSDASINGVRMTYVSGTGTGYFDLRSSISTGGLVFRIDASNGSAERMRILPNGCIGVGTSTPIERFHVHNGAIRLTGAIPTVGGPMILWGNSGASPDHGVWGLEYTTVGNPGLNFWKPFGNTPWGNYFLFLSDNGKVGVKTNNPTADFTVNGKTLIGDPAVVTLPGTYNLYVQNGILTDKIRVAAVNGASWADYVFDSDYKLLSLDEVEKYITDHNHLPGVPAACEVEKNGVDLLEMEAILLQKVEELTLYIIQLKKENQELSDKINQVLINGK